MLTHAMKIIAYFVQSFLLLGFHMSFFLNMSLCSFIELFSLSSFVNTMKQFPIVIKDNATWHCQCKGESSCNKKLFYKSDYHIDFFFFYKSFHAILLLVFQVCFLNYQRVFFIKRWRKTSKKIIVIIKAFHLREIFKITLQYNINWQMKVIIKIVLL